jgi:hypothetical protein
MMEPGLMDYMEYIDRLRDWASERQKPILIGVSALVVAVAVVLIVCWWKGSDTPASAFSRMYICTETGKTFRHKDQEGETQPILSPYSDKNTGVPAEPCYWTADGGTKTEPTWVLLNSLAGKSEPTFCPDCGRLVAGHNPPPRPGAKPPPTKEQYDASHVNNAGR